MPAIKYRVTLTPEEVEELKSLLHKGRSAARKQTRARILLKTAEGCPDKEIMEAPDVSASVFSGSDDHSSGDRQPEYAQTRFAL